MTYTLQGKHLSLSGDPERCCYAVSFENAVWRMTDRPCVVFEDGDAVEFPAASASSQADTGTASCIRAEYRISHGGDITLRTTVSLEHSTDDIRFTLVVEGDTRCLIRRVCFPAPFDFGAAYGDCGVLTARNLPESYTVLPRMQGVLIPAGKPIDIHDGIADGIVFERDSYLPMFGQVRKDTGYLAVYETPYDVEYDLRDERVCPQFVPSLGYMAYPRTVLYRFLQGCDYNDLAHEYRAWLKERGQLVTLKEKLARNPKIADLIGCPVIHSGIARHVSPDSDFYDREHPENNDQFVSFAERAKQIKALYDKGVRKAYTHFDGWGRHGYDNLHPDPMPPHERAGGWEGMKLLADTVNGCGYIFGIHDQYRDFYYDAPSFSLDKALLNADGSHPFCSVWEGGKHSFLCASIAREYVRRNYNIFAEQGVDIRASYLDVFSVVGLDQCFDPAHPMTREDCARYRRECLDFLTDRGIIPSSEETIGCMLPSIVLCHHAPFYTKELGAPMSEAVGTPIPLLNLVYHDCVIVPWIGRRHSRGGWCIPSNVSGYAYAKLCGNPGYLNIDADEQEIKDVQEVCEAAAKLAFQPMLRHEFVTPDGRVQRCIFADGTVTEVDFDAE